jgi:hypothetical protein
VETQGTCCSWAINSQTGPFASWSLEDILVPVNGGPPVPVRNWHGVMVSYGVTGHEGQTAMSVTIAHPGTYVLATKNVTPRTITDVAVGRGILRATVMPVFLGLGGLVALLGAGLSFGITAARRRRARRGLARDPGFGEAMPGSAPGDAPGEPVPVLVGFAGPARQDRGTVLVRAILALPQVICLYFVRYAAWLVLVTGWFGALFTGRLPDFAAEFLAGYQRWEIRVYAYLALLTDNYPPFGWRDTSYPVSVATKPGRLSRPAVLFRIILIIPAGLVWTVLSYGLGTVMLLITWLIVLIRGRMPQPLYEAIAAIVRYWARVKGYWYLLTDVYPAGLFGDRPEPVPGPGSPPQLALPADYVAQPAPAAAASAPSGVPGPLVLSRSAKRLVGLTLGIGAASPVALFIAVFALAAPVTPSPGAVPPAVAAQPSVAPSTAPAPASTAPAPPDRTDRWLKGLRLLRTHMYAAMGSNQTEVTPTLMTSTARQMSRCPAELAALGPPPAPLRPAYQMARHACADYQQGAACYAAAARGLLILNPNIRADRRKLTRLFHCGDSGANKGARLIANATANGSFAKSQT